MQKEEHDERRHGGILLPPIPPPKKGLISQDRRPIAYSPTQGCEELVYLTRFFLSKSLMRQNITRHVEYTRVTIEKIFPFIA